MRMIFKAEEFGMYDMKRDRPPAVITIKEIHEASSLDDVFEEFKGFLQSCGFCIEGEIEVVKDEEEGL